LVLTIEPQNQKYLTIQLSIPFIFGHPAVLLGGFANVDDTWRGAHMSAFPLSPPFFTGSRARLRVGEGAPTAVVERVRVGAKQLGAQVLRRRRTSSSSAGTPAAASEQLGGRLLTANRAWGGRRWKELREERRGVTHADTTTWGGRGYHAPTVEISGSLPVSYGHPWAHYSSGY
jgi:hypothetical protein